MLTAIFAIATLAKLGVIPGEDWPDWALGLVGGCFVIVWVFFTFGEVLGYLLDLLPLWHKRNRGAISDAAITVARLKEHQPPYVREERIDRR